MRLLIDMNLSPLWAPFLEQHGFDAVHWSTLGAANAPDTVIFGFAREQSLVIFTHDLDFGKILAIRMTNGPGVVQLRVQDVLPSAIGEIASRYCVPLAITCKMERW